MSAQHGSQDSALSHIDAEIHLADRLVDGDLGEHVGIPSTEQVASVADQAAKMNMRKLGSRCARSPAAGACLCGKAVHYRSGPLPTTERARHTSSTSRPPTYAQEHFPPHILHACAVRSFTVTNSFTRRWKRAP